MKVARGVLATERNAVRRLQPSDPSDVAQRALEIVCADPPSRYDLKDRRDLMRRLIRGESDFYGRRLFTDASISDAKYVVRFINARLRGAAITERQKSLVRGSLLRVYQALESGRDDLPA